MYLSSNFLVLQVFKRSFIQTKRNCFIQNWRYSYVLLFARETDMTSVYMGGWVDNSTSSMGTNSKESSVVAGKNTYKNLLVASRPKGFAQRNYEQLVSFTHGDFGSSVVGRATFFLLKVAALEIVRRFSKSKCPCVWRGLQGLQILVYPPFKWIQRWAPFRGLVKSMQVCDY